MKNLSLSIVAALCVSVPVMVLAEPGKSCSGKAKKYHHIEQMDANQDGKVSFDEFNAGHNDKVKKKFERMDANADGFISKEDKQAAHGKRAGQFFDKADSNNDGVLSKEEFSAAKKHHQGKRDHDKPH